MARIKYGGEELAAPPADRYWTPGEIRDIDDAEWAERLLLNPNFQKVSAKQEKETSSEQKDTTPPAQ